MGKKRLFHFVAKQIIGQIEDGVFPAGTRLPNEKELAERFDVSRVTIREVTTTLQTIRRIEIKSAAAAYTRAEQPEDCVRLPDVSAFEPTAAR